MGRQLIKCPDFIEAGLIYLELEMGRVWGNFGLKFVSPFRNTGTNFKNDVFEVNAYDWSGKSDAPNFRCDGLEIYWYKYMGRDMWMNMNIDANEFFKLIDKCVKSIRGMEDEVDDFGLC